MSTAPADGEAPCPAAGGAARRRGGVIGVTVVCVVAGLLFGTSASLARTRPLSGEISDLVGLITARDREVSQLNERADRLRTDVASLQDRVDSSEARRLSRSADRVAPRVGLAPVAGPAVRVTLDDAGYTLQTLPEGYTVDDVVVHQEDLQGVINALWAGGAEAVMVQDQRIVSTSSVQCVGNTLYLQGRVYSPPYTVTAIGDVGSMRSALEADPVVDVYRQWADTVGLGYTVEDVETAEMPGFTGTVRPDYATAVRDLEPGEILPTPQD
ncbi:DUF881 domain-containing protein [Ornithinimicrobium avium]|uniref:DUF881 domain-containing protein n=1 Tax=Ornithinimicrobium avium TaxID=2283195 RepID=A0A345NP47_9MICO|nr:DUF881 domain-containing protein [Ornithinimicrobium avium]AXH96805.1 DUF881 domain-containing protein [Ornithinimicrobium avium]